MASVTPRTTLWPELMNDEHNERLATESDEGMAKMEPEWWDAFTVTPGQAYPKQPLRVKAGREAMDAADARAMRRAATVFGQRARPKGFWGKFWTKTMIKVLNKMAEAIEEGKL